jgi:hypothetical protein
VKLISPAPGGTRGLAYGDTTVRPYSPSRPHRGQDWEREWRDLSKPRPVVAPVSGRVSKVYSGPGYNQGWGRRVEITVPATGVKIVAALNHLDTVAVHAGQDVTAGQYIGEMGDSGETAGVHLHEELWINGERVNPNTYRTQHLPGTSTTAGGDSRPFDPKGFLMALSDKQQEDMYNNIAGNNRPFADFIAQAVLDMPIKRAGRMGGTTTLRAIAAYSDENIEGTRDLVRALKGGTGNIDVKVLADELTKTLGPSVAAELARRLQS